MAPTSWSTALMATASPTPGFPQFQTGARPATLTFSRGLASRFQLACSTEVQAALREVADRTWQSPK